MIHCKTPDKIGNMHFDVCIHQICEKHLYGGVFFWRSCSTHSYDPSSLDLPPMVVLFANSPVDLLTSVSAKEIYIQCIYGGFLKWWVSPTTMGFPTKNDHFGVFWRYHHLRKHPYTYMHTHTHIYIYIHVNR